MENNSLFEQYMLNAAEAMSVEGGVDPVVPITTTTTTTTPIAAVEKAKHDKIAHFKSKLAEVKASTKFSADQKAKLTEVFTKHVTALKA